MLIVSVHALLLWRSSSPTCTSIPGGRTVGFKVRLFYFCVSLFPLVRGNATVAADAPKAPQNLGGPKGRGTNIPL